MPSAVPIYETDQFELMINLKAAKQIGLTIPPSVLARADNVKSDFKFRLPILD